MKTISTIAKLETTRLVLRQWQDTDYPAYAEISGDPVVMEYFPQTLNRRQSDAKVDNMRKAIRKKGWGFWAVELKETGKLIGLTGLNIPVELPFIHNVEIGWQFAADNWGKGYATEAANAALSFAFKELDLSKVVAFTSEINERSRAVMIRLGMQDSGTSFAHPAVPDGNPLKQHVLYEISKSAWRT